jgi:hypothetical protein
MVSLEMDFSCFAAAAAAVAPTVASEKKRIKNSITVI